MTRAKQQANGAQLRNVWTVATQGYEGAHFATFPTKLIEPCIKSGTSQHGVCAKCGAPWARDVEVEHRQRADMKEVRARGSNPTELDPSSRWDGYPDLRKVVTTKGWVASCECGADVVPATVLDPFGGSGTVGLVADRLGRDAILIEISPEYAQMAADRITADAPMFTSVELVGAEPTDKTGD